MSALPKKETNTRNNIFLVPTPPLSVEDLVKKHLDLDNTISILTEKREAIKNQLLDMLPEGTTPAAGVKVNVVVRKTLDATKFEQTFPYGYEINQKFYKQGLNTAEIKKYFSPVDLEVFQKQGKPTLTIR